MEKRKIYFKKFYVNGHVFWCVAKYYGFKLMNTFIYFDTTPVNILSRSPWLYDEGNVEIEISNFMAGCFYI